MTTRGVACGGRGAEARTGGAETHATVSSSLLLLLPLATDRCERSLAHATPATVSASDAKRGVELELVLALLAESCKMASQSSLLSAPPFGAEVQRRADPAADSLARFLSLAAGRP